MQPDGTPIAILAADIHLSHTAPACRCTEDDWYVCMGAALGELEGLQTSLDVPLVVAGDVFDRWNCPPELINFAIRYWPKGTTYAVPGQHDMPWHRGDSLDRSAYGTLVLNGTLTNLPPGKPHRHSDKLVLWGYPWGSTVLGPEPVPNDDAIHLAVIHDMCWRGKDKGWAPSLKHMREHARRCAGYDVAVFGDNHDGFLATGETDGPGRLRAIFNCGGFMRRTIAQRYYQPQVGLLYDTGQVVPYLLSAPREDKIVDTAGVLEFVREHTDHGAGALIDQLGALGHDRQLDFRFAVRAHCEKCNHPNEVMQIILQALDG